MNSRADEQKRRMALINVVMQSINEALAANVGLIVNAPTDEEFRGLLAQVLRAPAEALAELNHKRIGFINR